MILFEEKTFNELKAKQIILIILIKITNKKKLRRKGIACEFLKRTKGADVD